MNSRLLAKTIEASGLFLGMLIGAGMFALPYSFGAGGVSWSLLLFGIVFILSLLLHYLYAAVIDSTPGHHRFTGYVKRYLGARAEKAALVFTLLSFEGTMLAYGVLAGDFLHTIFGISPFIGGFLFLLAGGSLFLLSLNSVGRVDFYLSLALFGFVAFLALKLAPFFESSNLTIVGKPDYFLPYGVFIFALAAYSALPDVHDVLGRDSSTLFKRVIFWELLAGALLYLVFAFSVLGMAGSAVSEDGFGGLDIFLGGGIIVGSIIGLLAIIRTYMGLGADLKLLFKYDYGFSSTNSWLLAFAPSFLLFAIGYNDLIGILGFVGAVGLGVFGLFIILMAWHNRLAVEKFLGFRLRLHWLLPMAGLITLGALQSIWSLL